ncbi:MAG: hydrogenase maturation protease [Ignavibacteria bacterium]|nr:hydrogenase maturation protease [Ignavibacteria bacterium]
MDNSKTLVIGIGNEYRGDDAAGLLAARRIRDNAPKGIEVIENSGDGADLIAMWAGKSKVVLIDAVLSGSPAGTIHKFTAPGPVLPSEIYKFSSHLFSVTQAIYLSASLGNLPQELTIYGIEAASFDSGTQISAEVETAINNVVQSVSQII